MEAESSSVSPVVRDFNFIIDQGILGTLWESYFNLEDLDSVELQMTLTAMYEETVGIGQGKLHTDQMPLVTTNVETNVMIDSLLERTITRLMTLGIPKSAGMGITDLLALPTYEIQMYVRAAVSISVKDKKILSEIESELE